MTNVSRNDRSQRHAEALLALLEEWLLITHMWEDYLTAVVNGEFKTNSVIENEMLAQIKVQTEPLKTKTREAGYSHSDLLAILPHAFRTTYETREADVQSLREMVHGATETCNLEPPW